MLQKCLTTTSTALLTVAVTAWIFVYAILFASAPLLLLHRLHIRCLWHSCALQSGLNCFRFWQAQSYIPAVLNNQRHRQSRTKSGGGGKWTCFSCRRFLLSAPVCIAPCHSSIFSAHFCAHGLPFIISFPCWIFERILHNLQSCCGGCSCKKTVKKIRNPGRRFYDF